MTEQPDQGSAGQEDEERGDLGLLQPKEQHKVVPGEKDEELAERVAERDGQHTAKDGTVVGIRTSST